MSYEKYVFLDESGDQGYSSNSSKYFVITLLVTEDKKPIENKLNKFKLKLMRKKKYKFLNEVKANNSDDLVRFEVLDILAKAEVEIYVVILNKSKLYGDLRDKKNESYNFLTNLILAECDLENKSVHFVIDRRVKNKFIREDFDNYIKSKNPKVRFDISHFDSCNSNGLQLVDFVSWAVFRGYEFRDSRFYDKISNKVVFRKELFN